MHNRLAGCQHKRLSQVGKATLIKSVIQAIPVYSMSTFKVPVTICKELDSLTRRFWWEAKPDATLFWALKAWSSICIPTSKGGLGFRCFKNINLALIPKLGWKLASGDNSLWATILKPKYLHSKSFFFFEQLKKKSFFECKPTKTSSSVWKGILISRNILLRGACF